MKKHWVNFTATIHGSILVEGDENSIAAGQYVKRNLDFSASAEGVDAEINEHRIEIDEAYPDNKGECDGTS